MIQVLSISLRTTSMSTFDSSKASFVDGVTKAFHLQDTAGDVPVSRPVKATTLIHLSCTRNELPLAHITMGGNNFTLTGK